jgi:hypothetical protein
LNTTAALSAATVSAAIRPSSHSRTPSRGMRERASSTIAT